LAGLYAPQREAGHSYWINRGVLAFRGDSFVNLIHYEDAASLAVSLLAAGKDGQGKIYLGSDGEAVTRQQILDVVFETLGRVEDKPEFKTKEGPLGKKYDNSWTREQLGWKAHVNLLKCVQGIHGANSSALNTNKTY